VNRTGPRIAPARTAPRIAPARTAPRIPGGGGATPERRDVGARVAARPVRSPSRFAPRAAGRQKPARCGGGAPRCCAQGHVRGGAPMAPGGTCQGGRARRASASESSTPGRRSAGRFRLAGAPRSGGQEARWTDRPPARGCVARLARIELRVQWGCSGIAPACEPRSPPPRSCRAGPPKTGHPHPHPPNPSPKP
jgi:hypothetical protein